MASDSFFDVSIEEKEFAEALATAERMHDSITPQWIKSTQRRHLRPMVEAMKSNSKSTRIAKLIGVTTAKKRAGDYGAKVGVVKDDKDRRYNISGPAHGALLEYGSKGERFRILKRVGIVTVRQSTGVMPATPYLRPAWDQHVKAFMDATQDSIEKRVMKEAGDG